MQREQELLNYASPSKKARNHGFCFAGTIPTCLTGVPGQKVLPHITLVREISCHRSVIRFFGEDTFCRWSLITTSMHVLLRPCLHPPFLVYFFVWVRQKGVRQIRDAGVYEMDKGRTNVYFTQISLGMLLVIIVRTGVTRYKAGFRLPEIPSLFINYLASVTVAFQNFTHLHTQVHD